MPTITGMHELHGDVAGVLGPSRGDAPHRGAGREPPGERERGGGEIVADVGTDRAVLAEAASISSVPFVDIGGPLCRVRNPAAWVLYALAGRARLTPSGPARGDMTRQGARAEQDELTRLAIFEAFVDASHDALFSQDTGERIVIWNRSAERIFGYHAADVVGVPVLATVPGARPRRGRACSSTRCSAATVSTTSRPRSSARTGWRCRSRCRCPGRRDRGGASFGFVGVARDLTEQRLTQATLAEAEARLREAEAFAHAGRWLWDIASDTVQWSEEMHRIHGVDPASFDGTMTSHLAVVHPEDVERAAGRPRRRGRTPADRSTSSTASVAATAPSDGCTPAPSRRSARWAWWSGSAGSHRTSPNALNVRRARGLDSALADHPAHTVDEVGADHGRTGGGT